MNSPWNNSPWNYIASNAPDTSPQFPSDEETQFYEVYDSFTSALNSAGDGVKAGAESGVDSTSANTMYPSYLPAGSGSGSGLLPYSDSGYGYTYVYPSPSPVHYRGIPPRPGSSRTLLMGEGSDMGIVPTVAGGSLYGWGGTQTEPLVKCEGGEGLEMPRVSQSRASVAATASADNGAIEHGYYKGLLSGQFSEIDLKEISPSRVIFFFGVLATQALLLPRFEFTQGHVNQKWGGVLTMYGHTFVEPAIFKSQCDAKLELCQAALKKLVAQFPGWSVPGEPGDVSSQESNGWDWVKTLHDYCVQNGLREPEYTPSQVSPSSWRHRVQLEGGSFFGFLNTYPDEWESKNATAHMGLHSILVNGNGVVRGSSGPSSLQRSNESLLACVPSAPPGVGKASDSPSQPIPAQGDKQKAFKNAIQQKAGKKRAPKRKASKRKAGGDISGDNRPKNANLLPVVGSKVASINIEAPKEVKKKWKFTPGELQNKLKGLPSQSDRLKKACLLLSLQFPEIRIDRLDGRLVETGGEYTAAAYFQGDPFLTRAGAIGRFTGTKPNKSAAREACAGNVVTYLIKMVNEDTVQEEIAANQRAEPYQWRENIENVYEKAGWLG